MADKNCRSDVGFRSRGLAVLAFIMLFASFSGLIWINEAQALRISMKRIIFEGSKRSDIITILNNTAKEQTYRLGWRRYRMDERRSLVNVEEDDPAAKDLKWAEDMIRYAPRRVVVPAGGSQQVRLLLRRPRDLAPGEYRAHLWIITETEPEAFAPGEGAKKGQQSFRLTMQPALTMPVFVRHGEMSAKASITEASVERTEDGGSVSFVLNREGNRSLYGDVKIVCIAAGGEYEASYTRGIAVYTEVNKRYLSFDYAYPPEQASNCAVVRIEYIADSEDSLYSGQVMAQAVAR